MLIAALYKSNRPGISGLYNRMVRWWERGPYSHCELIFSDGLAASSSYTDGGVRFKHIDFHPEHWDFIELPAHLEPLARYWFEKHAGEKYDMRGNVRFFAGFMNDGDGQWFCSEALAAALGMKESWRYGPNGLAAVLKFFYK